MATVTTDPATGLQTILVNRAQWTAPEIPDGWLIANAPRPISGQITWEGDFRHGIFYAASPELPAGSWGWKADDAWLVEFVTNADIEARIEAKLAEYGTTLDEAGLSWWDMACDMQLPYVV